MNKSSREQTFSILEVSRGSYLSSFTKKKVGIKIIFGIIASAQNNYASAKGAVDKILTFFDHLPYFDIFYLRSTFLDLIFNASLHFSIV